MDTPLSDRAHERAVRSLAGGVNSPVRSFQAVETTPIFVRRGEGPYVWDLDGNRDLDLLMSWGALILGHADPGVRKAFPSVELLRFVNSGTEAVMSAVRLARGFTARPKVLVFEGCYHGHSDGLLARAGSGVATLGLPGCAGVPGSFTGETVLARFNDLDSVQSACRKHGDQLAAILVEPVAGNMGVVPPAEGFLEGLRKGADRTGALLIFDEVITGFRVALGGAQQLYGVRPDLTTLGKIVGGGLPVGAFGGRRDVMERLAPIGDVYQAGTLSGNPVVMAAGREVLDRLSEDNPYHLLHRAAEQLALQLTRGAREAGIELRVACVGPMLTVFFSHEDVTNYASARRSDTSRYAQFFRGMRARGVLLPPSQFEASFLSVRHGPEQIKTAIQAARGAMADIAAGGEKA